MARTLAFLEPGHFHAALLLRERHPDVREEILVYAREGPELRDFLDLIAAFNRRAARPTAWRPVVRASGDPLADLLGERRGDAVVLAGRNDRKMSLARRLHDAGLPVLADKPWLAGPDGLDDVRRVLAGPPLCMEMMTGRHEQSAILLERLVRERDVFGGFASGPDAAAISLGSVHHLAKVVNGAPLRRPPWYFDVRVQGDGIADIPTHQVDRAQRLVAAAGAGSPADLRLLSARRWPTMVPRDLFTRVTGERDFPPEISASVDRDTLAYLGNGELHATVGGVTLELTTRWELIEPPGGGDTSQTALRGTRAEIRVEQGPATGFRRRLTVHPRDGAGAAAAALERAVAAWQRDLPGLTVAAVADGLELVTPDALRSGHESHFALVLDEFLRHVDRGSWPPELSTDTLAKYALLVAAGAAARAAAG